MGKRLRHCRQERLNKGEITFSSDEIVSRSETVGDSELHLTTVIVERIGSPVVLADQAELGDLEPVGGTKVIGEGIVDSAMQVSFPCRISVYYKHRTWPCRQ